MAPDTDHSAGRTPPASPSLQPLIALRSLASSASVSSSSSSVSRGHTPLTRSLQSEFWRQRRELHSFAGHRLSDASQQSIAFVLSDAPSANKTTSSPVLFPSLASGTPPTDQAVSVPGSLVESDPRPADALSRTRTASTEHLLPPLRERPDLHHEMEAGRRISALRRVLDPLPLPSLLPPPPPLPRAEDLKDGNVPALMLRRLDSDYEK